MSGASQSWLTESGGRKNLSLHYDLYRLLDYIYHFLPPNALVGKQIGAGISSGILISLNVAARPDQSLVNITDHATSSDLNRNHSTNYQWDRNMAHTICRSRHSNVVLKNGQKCSNKNQMLAQKQAKNIKMQKDPTNPCHFAVCSRLVDFLAVIDIRTANPFNGHRSLTNSTPKRRFTDSINYK